VLAEIKAQAEGFLKSPTHKKSVLGIFGDVALDRFVFGDVTRISPEAPVPVLNLSRSEDRLGCAANVLANAAELCGSWGLGLKFLTVVGEDKTADRIESLVSNLALDIDVDFLSDSSRQTALKTRYLAGSQHQLLRVDQETSTALSAKMEDKLLSRFGSFLSGLSVVVLQDYAKGLFTKRVAQEMIRMAKEKKVYCIVDPCMRTPFENYIGASLITPNVSETEALLGAFDLKKGAEDSLVEEAIQSLKTKLELESVMITRSQYGLSLLNAKDQKVYHLPAVAREVFDVTGAGDTVVAVLAATLASGADLPTASLLATIAASVVVAKVGTSVVKVSELEKNLSRIAL